MIRAVYGFAILVLFTPWSGFPQQPGANGAQQNLPEAVTFPPMPKPETAYPPPTGQTFTYSAEWRVFNAGTATLHLEQNGDEGRVSAAADAAGAVALLFHVHDRYESSFDFSTFCSKTINKDIEEGLRHVDANINFDYQRHKAVLDQKNLKKGDNKRVENDIPDCVTDVLSAFYFVGSLPLQPGTTVSFPLNDGGKTVTVDVHSEAREQIKTPAGTFNTIRVEPDVPSGVLKGKGKIWIWYTEEAPRIPVRVKARLFWGTVILTLLKTEKK